MGRSRENPECGTAYGPLNSRERSNIEPAVRYGHCNRLGYCRYVVIAVAHRQRGDRIQSIVDNAEFGRDRTGTGKYIGLLYRLATIEFKSAGIHRRQWRYIQQGCIGRWLAAQ